MDSFINFLVFLGLVLAAVAWFVDRRRARAAAAGGAGAPAHDVADAADAPADDDIVAHAYALAPFFEATAHPRDLLGHAPFRHAVERAAGRSTAELLGYAAGPNAVAACIALETVATQTDEDDDATDALLAMLPVRYGWRAWFALRALHARAHSPVAGPVLVRLDPHWTDPQELGWIIEFLGWRVQVGEAMTWATELRTLTGERYDAVDALVTALGEALPEPLRAEYDAWRVERIDLGFPASIGRVHGAGAAADDADIVEHAALRAAVDDVESAVCGATPRATVLVGEPGVGKSTALARAVQRMRRNGWLIFEVSANELIAGMMFVGQLDDRVIRLVRETAGRNVVWHIAGDFHELLHAGQHMQRPTGVLDLLMPYLESGELRIMGETTPAAFQTLLQQRPRLRGLLKQVRVEPLGADATLALAREWGAERVADPVLREAQQLALQYLSERAMPGALLHFLKQAAQRVRLREGHASITLEDLLHTLAAQSGLPLDVLDDRIALDLQELRRFFAARVLGQDEAVDTLVERVALIKAGLTDPTRPAGVFLFVGPTGTGKTELAKALAEYLFGSPERMIRLDMSELQDPLMLGRLLGQRGEPPPAGTSLVDDVRRQPFCVVLLDELEKAHPRVWDLFLQLFDDGRLTDQNGNTASFRNAIVIMTSNVGGGGGGAGIGFGGARAAAFTPGDIERAIRETFRPEFINRIDRIVMFRPLARGIMRALLDKEIRDVVGRRGLRNRPWAIEWEESAIEFLIRHGFSPTLGARPLKRAVERYLLAPLALSIVDRRVPEGDQFLLIGTAGDRLTVDFVDPDAIEPAAEPAAQPGDDAAHAPALEDIVRDARGDAAEIDALAAEYEHLRESLAAVAWQTRKRQALADIARPDFWDDPDRFATLGLAEYMDRVEVGLDTAGSLLGRIHGGARNEGRAPRQLVRRLAQQLYLVGEAVEGIEAGAPRDAFVHVRAVHEPGADSGAADAFAVRIARMYRRWAEQRRMRIDVLEEVTASDDAVSAVAPYSSVLAVSGFAAYRILAPEHGQHVLEVPAHGKAFTRVRALVDIAPQPDAPPAGGTTLLQQARAVLAACAAERHELVRRYREEPSPLVRDAVRGWRTGRLDDVLDGGFDLMG